MPRVFILGSGFSTGAGAPLSRSVLQAVFPSAQLNPRLAGLKSYLTDFLFGGRPEWIMTADFEEVLSRLDLIRHYRPYPDVDYHEVSFYEDFLIREFTGVLSPHKVTPRGRAYDIFKDLVNCKDDFISFNYDLVLETLLTSSGKKYDYSLEESGQATTVDRPVKLLKLHGSINLFYCPACSEVFQVSPDHNQSLFCDLCNLQGKHIKLSHFIIAPTLFKSFTLPTLRRLWYKALETLTAASELYFIGYSLPEADILTYQLLDFGNRMCNSCQDVYLIDGPRSTPERFRQIYGDRLKNTGAYFEEWVEGMTK